jgi:TatD DNase family protein
VYHPHFFPGLQMAETALPELIDIGVNLGHESFAHDRELVLARAREAGVRRMVLTGTSVAGSTRAAELAAEHPGMLYSTAGVHPHDAAGFTSDSYAQLLELSRQTPVVAIGETGLDFNRDYSPRDRQESAFAEQLALAVATGLPIFLHQRDAQQRFMGILQEQRDGLQKGVVHCFTGSRDELHAYRDMDMYIGITGWVCDERRGTHLQELLQDIPDDRLLLETDAPYLLPRNMQPKPKQRRNEPANLVWVLAMVAACLRRDPVELAAQCTRNTRVFFAI